MEATNYSYAIVSCHTTLKVVFLSIGGLCVALSRMNKDPLQGVSSIQNPPPPPSEVVL